MRVPVPGFYNIFQKQIMRRVILFFLLLPVWAVCQVTPKLSTNLNSADSNNDNMMATNRAIMDMINMRVASRQSNIYVNVRDFGAKGNGIANDAPAIQAAFNYIKNNPLSGYKIVFPAGNYLVNSTIQLPQRISAPTESVRLEIEGYGARLFTNASIPIFERMPANQRYAEESLISNWIGSIRGFTFEGNNSVGQVGIRVGAIYSWVIENCTFRTLDTALIFRFSLQGAIKQCRFQSCRTDNINLFDGEMWGGNDANSASNSNSIENCRVFGASGANSHLRAEASNAVIIRNFISEGGKPRYNIINDSRGSTTVTFCDFENLHIEANGGSIKSNTVFRLRSNGTFRIKNVYLQYPDTLFNSINSGGSSTILFDGIPYLGALPAVAFNAGGSSVLGYHINFRNMGDDDYSKKKIFNAASWAGGVRPLEISLYYEKGSGTGVTAIASGGTIGLESNTTLEGRLLWPSDNVYHLGGIPQISNQRPTDLFVGSGGIYVDNDGKYNFGSATATPDVSIERSAPATARINANQIVLNGLLQLGSESAVDANFKSSAHPGLIVLPDITANRTITLSPSAAAGQLIIVLNSNTTGKSWSFSGTTVKNADGHTITSLANGTMYLLVGRGGNTWVAGKLN